MYDPTDERPRYLVHYSDGGSGMRRSGALLAIVTSYAMAAAATESSTSSIRRTRTRSVTPGRS